MSDEREAAEAARAEVAEPGDGPDPTRGGLFRPPNPWFVGTKQHRYWQEGYDAATAGREPLDARIRVVLAEHEGEGGYARFGGDALLRDVRAALDTPDPGAP